MAGSALDRSALAHEACRADDACRALLRLQHLLFRQLQLVAEVALQTARTAPLAHGREGAHGAGQRLGEARQAVGPGRARRALRHGFRALLGAVFTVAAFVGEGALGARRRGGGAVGAEVAHLRRERRLGVERAVHSCG